jgi:hypothetical protein
MGHVPTANKKLHFNDILDHFLSVVESAYCYKEWRKKADKIDLPKQLSGTDIEIWHLARDIYNRRKHLTVGNPSIDPKFLIKRESDPFAQLVGKPDHWHLNIHFGRNNGPMKKMRLNDFALQLLHIIEVDHKDAQRSLWNNETGTNSNFSLGS